jgi:hypothetical protein
LSVHSDQQPDNPAEKPAVGQAGEQRIAISREALLKMRSEDALLIRETDWFRYIKTIRNLESQSTNWLGVAFTLIGVGASFTGIALAGSTQVVLFVSLAVACGIGATGCLLAHRQVNERRDDLAEELASEMEEGALDRLVVMPIGQPETRGDPDLA